MGRAWDVCMKRLGYARYVAQGGDWATIVEASPTLSPSSPDEVEVFPDDKKLALEPGQSVTPHGIDRGLDPDEILKRGADSAGP